MDDDCYQRWPTANEVGWAGRTKEKIVQRGLDNLLPSSVLCIMLVFALAINVLGHCHLWVLVSLLALMAIDLLRLVHTTRILLRANNILWWAHQNEIDEQFETQGQQSVELPVDSLLDPPTRLTDAERGQGSVTVNVN